MRLPELHPHQQEIARDPTRFRVLACGRRWGKSRLAALLCVVTAARHKKAWWVSPSYPMSAIGWREIKRLALQIPGAAIHESDRRVEIGAGFAQVKSSDNPNSLRGEGLDFLALDECAFMSEEAWQEALRPTLSDRQGKAIFISTPKGLNWFHELYRRGKDDGGEWKSWKFPTGDNPFIEPAEVEAARAGLPERVFQQEYLAEFLADGSYFQNLDLSAIIKKRETPDDHAGHTFYMAIDWALSGDFTVLGIGCRECKRVVDWDRFNRLDFTYQRERVYSLAERWKVKGCLPERNSIGAPNIELIRNRVRVLRGEDGAYGFNTTGSTKPALIQGLATALEHEGYTVPVDALEELRAYEVELTSAGHPRFSAPSGKHDDWVIMLALLWRAMTGYHRESKIL